jgi:hypothetical protein
MNGFNTRVRLWDIQNKTMLPSFPLHKANFAEVDCSRYRLFFSIGEKDKHGAEIYAGDTVCVPAGYSGDHYYEECTAVVEYDAPEFLLTNKADKHGVVGQDFSWSDLKIINTPV